MRRIAATKNDKDVAFLLELYERACREASVRKGWPLDPELARKLLKSFVGRPFRPAAFDRRLIEFQKAADEPKAQAPRLRQVK